VFRWPQHYDVCRGTAGYPTPKECVKPWELNHHATIYACYGDPLGTNTGCTQKTVLVVRKPVPSGTSPPSSQRHCDPGANTGLVHVFKVTIACLFSGEAFYDPALKLKERCIASVGFDALTDLIPGAKIKLLKTASKPIGRDAKALGSALTQSGRFDQSLLNSLDDLGQAITLVTHHPKDVVGLFVTSDRVLRTVATKLGTHSTALADLTKLQHALKGLFLSLTGYGDVEKCVAAFK
jgi:hypothetical protein